MYSNLSEKFSVKTPGGCQYYITLIDEKTRYIWIRFLKLKFEAFAVLESMIREVEKQTDRKLKAIRTNNAGKYITIDRTLDKKGIVHERSFSYFHESNGLSERLNRTIVTMTRGMLASFKLPLFL